MDPSDDHDLYIKTSAVASFVAYNSSSIRLSIPQLPSNRKAFESHIQYYRHNMVPEVNTKHHQM